MQLLGVDIGGTFTDAVLLDTASGELRSAKALSSVSEPEKGLLAVLSELGIRPEEPDRFVHGTTLVTNLLIERAGSVVGLITTAGFRDILEIQRSHRWDLYDLQWRKTEPLVPRDLRLEVTERTLSDGAIGRAPQQEEVLAAADALLSVGAEVIAICFINSHLNGSNEHQAAHWIRRHLPEVPLSLSSIVDPQPREYERLSTAVINAYAIPAIVMYLHRLESSIRPDVLFMHHGGGLMPAAVAIDHPARLVLSGPAGGVTAAVSTVSTGEALVPHGNLLTFDMGGTSTDVCLVVESQPRRSAEIEVVRGIPLRGDALGIETVGAGGGSIATIDAGGALQVGPRSAGADPGPACYRRGGREPTVTDANLLLGILNAKRFLGGEIELDEGAAQEAIGRLARRLNIATEDIAKGIHQVVNANMAQLIRGVTAKNGVNPRDIVLVSYGGAGGQHAYGVAEIVGCPEVIFPRGASTFSALGLVLARPQTTETRTKLAPLDALEFTALAREFEELEAVGRGHLFLPEDERSTVERRVAMRYIGQSHEVWVTLNPGDDRDALYRRFETTHRSMFGTMLGDPAEVISISATVSLERVAVPAVLRRSSHRESPEILPKRSRYVALFGSDVPVFDGDSLPVGTEMQGPVLIDEPDTVIVVPPRGRLGVEEQAWRLKLR